MPSPLSCMCAADLDLFVGHEGESGGDDECIATNELWLNDGAGGFSLASGGPTGYALTAAFGDVDGDGGALVRHLRVILA